MPTLPPPSQLLSLPPLQPGSMSPPPPPPTQIPLSDVSPPVQHEPLLEPAVNIATRLRCDIRRTCKVIHTNESDRLELWRELSPAARGKTPWDVANMLLEQLTHCSHNEKLGIRVHPIAATNLKKTSFITDLQSEGTGIVAGFNQHVDRLTINVPGSDRLVPDVGKYCSTGSSHTAKKETVADARSYFESAVAAAHNGLRAQLQTPDFQRHLAKVVKMPVKSILELCIECGKTVEWVLGVFSIAHVAARKRKSVGISRGGGRAAASAAFSASLPTTTLQPAAMCLPQLENVDDDVRSQFCSVFAAPTSSTVIPQTLAAPSPLRSWLRHAGPGPTVATRSSSRDRNCMVINDELSRVSAARHELEATIAARQSTHGPTGNRG